MKKLSLKLIDMLTDASSFAFFFTLIKRLIMSPLFGGGISALITKLYPLEILHQKKSHYCLPITRCQWWTHSVVQQQDVLVPCVSGSLSVAWPTQVMPKDSRTIGMKINRWTKLCWWCWAFRFDAKLTAPSLSLTRHTLREMIVPSLCWKENIWENLFPVQP